MNKDKIDVKKELNEYLEKIVLDSWLQYSVGILARDTLMDRNRCDDIGVKNYASPTAEDYRIVYAHAYHTFKQLSKGF